MHRDLRIGLWQSNSKMLCVVGPIKPCVLPSLVEHRFFTCPQTWGPIRTMVTIHLTPYNNQLIVKTPAGALKVPVPRAELKLHIWPNWTVYRTL